MEFSGPGESRLSRLKTYPEFKLFFLKQRVFVMLSLLIASGIIAALVSSITSVLIRNLQFKDDYYKTVIAKRLDAYNHVEQVIIKLKRLILTEDKAHTYHAVFDKYEYFLDFISSIAKSIDNGLWLSDEIIEKLLELNSITILFNSDTAPFSHKIAIENQDKITNIRLGLEMIIAKDMGSLHKVNEFLQRKRKDSLLRKSK